MSKNKVSIIKAVLSVLASFIGIQSNVNRERDFKSNSPVLFIVIGIIVAIFFIMSLYFLVYFILG